MAWTFCSKEDVTAFHPIPMNDLRDEWSEMVEGLIRDHLGQPYLGVSQAVTDEWHNGDGSVLLKPRHTPIISVQSLTVNDAVLTAADYEVFPNYIQLRGQVFPQGNLNVKVDYTSGSVTEDPVVRLTAVSMVIAIINYKKRAGADGSLKWSAAEQKVGEESPTTSVGLIKHLRDIMKGLLKRPHLRVR